MGGITQGTLDELVVDEKYIEFISDYSVSNDIDETSMLEFLLFRHLSVTVLNHPVPNTGVLKFSALKNYYDGPLVLSADIELSIDAVGDLIDGADGVLEIEPNGFATTLKGTDSFYLAGTLPTDEDFVLTYSRHSSGKVYTFGTAGEAITPEPVPLWEDDFTSGAYNGTRWPVVLTDSGNGVSRNVTGLFEARVNVGSITADSNVNQNQLGSELLPVDDEIFLDVSYKLGAATADSPFHIVSLMDSNNRTSATKYIRIDNVLNADRSLYSVRDDDGAGATVTSTTVDIVTNQRLGIHIVRSTGVWAAKYHNGSAWVTMASGTYAGDTFDDLYFNLATGTLTTDTNGLNFLMDYVKIWAGNDPA